MTAQAMTPPPPPDDSGRVPAAELDSGDDASVSDRSASPPALDRFGCEVCDETPDNFTAPGYPTVAEEKLFRRRENRSCDAPTRHSLGKRRREAEDDRAAPPRKASPPIVPTYAAPARDASSSDDGGGASSSDDDSAAASDDGGARGPPPRYADLSSTEDDEPPPLPYDSDDAPPPLPYDSDDAPPPPPYDSDDEPSDDEPPRLPYDAPSDDERPPPAYGDGSSDDEPRRVGGAPPERQILVTFRGGAAAPSPAAALAARARAELPGADLAAARAAVAALDGVASDDDAGLDGARGALDAALRRAPGLALRFRGLCAAAPPPLGDGAAALLGRLDALRAAAERRLPAAAFAAFAAAAARAAAAVRCRGPDAFLAEAAALEQGHLAGPAPDLAGDLRALARRAGAYFYDFEPDDAPDERGPRRTARPLGTGPDRVPAAPGRPRLSMPAPGRPGGRDDTADGAKRRYMGTGRDRLRAEDAGPAPGPAAPGDARPWLLAMRAELACPICLDVLEDAAALPCGHIFCDPCVSRDRQMTECPVCRASFRRRAVTPAATARAMVALLGEAGALDL